MGMRRTVPSGDGRTRRVVMINVPKRKSNHTVSHYAVCAYAARASVATGSDTGAFKQTISGMLHSLAST